MGAFSLIVVINLLNRCNMLLKVASRNFDSSLSSLLVNKLSQLDITTTRSTISWISHVGRRYDPRHGPSIYKNKEEDNTRLEGGKFSKHYRDRDGVKVNFTDRRIDGLKNPTSADAFLYKHFQSRRFSRQVFAKHGMASGVDPSICFPDKRELKKLLKHLDEERPISEMLAEIKQEREHFEKKYSKRQERIHSTMGKMPEMIRDWMETQAKERKRGELLRRKRREYSERIRQHYGRGVRPSGSEHATILNMLIDEDLQKEQGRNPDERAKQKKAKKEAKKQKGLEWLKNQAEDATNQKSASATENTEDSSTNETDPFESGDDVNKIVEQSVDAYKLLLKFCQSEIVNC